MTKSLKRPASPVHRAAVQEMVTESGEAKTAERLGVGASTVARIIAGFPLRAGTLALLREALGPEAAS